MINLDTCIWIGVICLAIGIFIGYFIKDNYTKPDEQINIELKKNKLFNKKEKRKIFNFKKNKK